MQGTRLTLCSPASLLTSTMITRWRYCTIVAMIRSLDGTTLIIDAAMISRWRYHISESMITRWRHCLNEVMITRWQYRHRAATITRWHYCISVEMVTGWWMYLTANNFGLQENINISNPPGEKTGWGATERGEIDGQKERGGREDAVPYENGG